MRCVIVGIVLSIASVASAQGLPSGVCDTLRALRGSGPITSSVQIGDILNKTAWTHRDDGWGLSGKTGGNRCPSPAGEIACDVLMRRSDSLIWDVFYAAGVNEPTTVVCGDALGPMTDPSRPFVAPVNSGGGGEEPPPPVGCNLTPVLTALAEVKAQVAGLDLSVDGAKLDQCAAESLNAAVRTLELQAQLTSVQISLEEHRAALQKAKRWIKDWKSWAAINDAEILRLLSTSLVALNRRGITNTAAMTQIYILGSDLYPVFVLKKRAFEPKEILLRYKAMHQFGLELISSYFPYLGQREGLNPALVALGQGETHLNNLDKMIQEKGYDISPITDNSPFFYEIEKEIPRSLALVLGASIIILLLMVLAPSILWKKD